MLEAMQQMLKQAEAKIAETESKIASQQVALYRLEGYRMALVDLIATYQKLENEDAKPAA